MRERLCTAAALAGLAAALLAGCEGGGTPQDDATTVHPTTSPAEPSTDPSVPADQPTDDSSPLAENVQAAIDDLAERTGVPAAEIQASPLEPVTWADGSLGCPSPGQAYPQVLTDGYRLVLTAGDEEYEYHAGGDGELFYCQDPSEPATQDVDRS